MTDYSPAKDSHDSYLAAIEALREQCTRADGTFDFELAERLVNGVKADEIRKRREGGWSITIIALDLGISKYAVRRALRDLNLPRRWTAWTLREWKLLEMDRC